MLVVAYHEFWHILVGVCMGNKLERVNLAPEIGGKTVFNAPELPEISLQPYACYFVSSGHPACNPEARIVLMSEVHSLTA